MSKITTGDSEVQLEITVPIVPSFLQINDGPSLPLARFSESVIKAVAAQWGKDLIAVRAEQADKLGKPAKKKEMRFKSHD